MSPTCLHIGPRRSQDPGTDHSIHRPSHVVDYARVQTTPISGPTAGGYQAGPPPRPPTYYTRRATLLPGADLAARKHSWGPRLAVPSDPRYRRFCGGLGSHPPFTGLSRVNLREKTQWKLHWMTPRDTTITHRQQTSPERFGPPSQRKSQWA